MFIGILNVYKISMGKRLSICGDVAVGEIDAVIVSNVAVTAAGERDEVTDVLRLIFGDVADAVAFMSDYLDSVLVVGVGRVGFQGGSELSEVVVYMFAVGDACNIKLDIVYTLKALIFWPDADMVAFVLDTEVAKFLNRCIFVVGRTDDYFNGILNIFRKRRQRAVVCSKANSFKGGYVASGFCSTL